MAAPRSSIPDRYRYPYHRGLMLGSCFRVCKGHFFRWIRRRQRLRIEAPGSEQRRRRRDHRGGQRALGLPAGAGPLDPARTGVGRPDLRAPPRHLVGHPEPSSRRSTGRRCPTRPGVRRLGRGDHHATGFPRVLRAGGPGRRQARRLREAGGHEPSRGRARLRAGGLARAASAGCALRAAVPHVPGAVDPSAGTARSGTCTAPAASTGTRVRRGPHGSTTAGWDRWPKPACTTSRA